ncbi:MAG: hypothetical protein ACI4OY_13880 [Aristaeellaceae bacterium]
MRRMLRAALAALMCLCLCAPALADARLVPEMAGVYLASEPLEIDLSVDVQAHMPFDDTRTEQLNAMLRHVSLSMQYQSLGGETWSRLAVLMDGDEVMAVHQRQTDTVEQVRFSFLPGTSYEWPAGSGCSLLSLLGGGEDETLPVSLDGGEESWLEDGRTLLDALTDAMPDNVRTSNISTTINGMGKAVKKQILTIPSSDTEGLGELLAGYVPEGRLKALLERLIFSGKQTVTLWRNAEGGILRANYAGNAGVSQEDLREVSLVWRMRRDDAQVLDDLTLRTPRVKGSGRNNVVLTRTLKEEDGQSTLEVSLRYEVLDGGVKTVLTGAADLTRTSGEDGARLAGEVSLQTQTGEESADKLVLTPDVVLTPGTEAPLAQGTVGVARYTGSSLKEQADVSVTVRLNDWMVWELQPNVIQVNEGNIDSIRRRIQQESTVALVRRLVLLPQEDTAFLSAGLEPDVWQQIVDAAQSALQEEVIP